MKHFFQSSPPPASVLITGASSGLGAALARYYADRGVTLYLAGRDKTRLSTVAKVCRETGAAVYEKIIDVRAKEDMTAWIRESFAKTPLDLVIANAGISGGTGGTQDGGGGQSESAEIGLPEPDSQVRDLFDVNLYGVLNTIHPALPLMAERGRGQVAIISSLAAVAPLPSAPAYSASKSAVKAYGEALAGCYRDSDVTVSVVCPGFIKTPLTDVNPYPMPFLMSAEDAAARIGKGLRRKKSLITFPYLLYGFIRILACLPYVIRTYILGCLPGKPVKNEKK